MTTLVNVDNFVRAETDRMFAALSAQAPINVLAHHREPASIENQPVIRQNRDTLYSSAIVDIAAGATLSLPDAGGRYLSVMVVNNDHYINDVFHDVGEHELTVDQFDTDYVLVAARILVDPNDPADLEAVHAAPGPDRSPGEVGATVRDARLRRGELRHDTQCGPHAVPWRQRLRRRVRPQGRRRPGEAPARDGVGLGWPAGT